MKFKHEIKKYNDIVSSIEEVTGINKRQFQNKGSRTADNIMIRAIFMYMCRTELKWTYQKIAQHMGYLDHSTIINGIRKVSYWLELPKLYERETDLLNMITEYYGQEYKDAV